MNNLMRRSAAGMVPAWRPGAMRSGATFERMVEHMVEDLLAPLAQGAGQAAMEEGTAIARLNVAETDKTYEVDLDMPGVKKDEVKVSITGNLVTAEAQFPPANVQQQGQKLLYAERTACKYTRSFTLPDDVDEAGAQARLEDGVLHLTLPKRQASQAHRINIQ